MEQPPPHEIDPDESQESELLPTDDESQESELLPSDDSQESELLPTDDESQESELLPTDDELERASGSGRSAGRRSRSGSAASASRADVAPQRSSRAAPSRAHMARDEGRPSRSPQPPSIANGEHSERRLEPASGPNSEAGPSVPRKPSAEPSAAAAEQPAAPAAQTPKRRGRPPKSATGGDTPASSRKATPKSKRGLSHDAESPSHKRRQGSVASSTSQLLGSAAAAEADPNANASLVHPTSSDAYFAAHAPSAASRARDATSRELLSAKLPPLQPAALHALSSLSPAPPQLPAAHWDALHSRWLGLLAAGFPVLFHGLGDARPALERFVSRMAEQGQGAAAVVRGEALVRFDELLAAAEAAGGLQKVRVAGDEHASTVEARAAAIAQAYADDRESRAARPPLFLLVHDVGAPALLAPRAQAVLATLAAAPRLRLLASVSHARAGALGGLGGPDWVWESLSTFVPREISSRAARTAGLPRTLHLGGAASSTAPGVAGAGGLVGANAPDLSAASALHVFKSVTSSAQQLFLRVAALQLTPAHAAGLSYAELGALAARNFIAMSAGSLAQVVHEFTSHGLLRRVETPQTQAQQQQQQSQSQSGFGQLGAGGDQGLAAFGADAVVRLALSKEELERAVVLCKEAAAQGRQ